MIDNEALESVAKAREAAMRWLARREYSIAELTSRLKHRGFGDGVVNELVAALVRDRSLSNERFVAALVHSRTERGFGPLKIVAELRAAGIDDTLIDTAVTLGDDQWIEAGRDAWRRRFARSGADRIDASRHGMPETPAEWAKQARYLTQRGFTASQIRTVLGGLGDDSRF